MTRNPYYRGPPSGHFDGMRFHNPGGESTDRTAGELLRWRFGGKRAVWDRVDAVEQAIPDNRVAGLRVTMVGHATLLIQVDGLNILTDPVWSDRARPVGFA